MEMAKSEMMMFRAEKTFKQRIKNAANKEGKSVTKFILDAVSKAVEMTDKKSPDRKFGGVPTWFRASCLEASQGGELGYKHIGHRFAQSLGSLLTQEWEIDECEEIIEQLEMIPHDDYEGIFLWLDEHFPKCMKLIPSRRKLQFLQAFSKQIQKEGIEI